MVGQGLIYNIITFNIYLNVSITWRNQDSSNDIFEKHKAITFHKLCTEILSLIDSNRISLHILFMISIDFVSFLLQRDNTLIS